jgi:hypothetical protein
MRTRSQPKSEFTTTTTLARQVAIYRHTSARLEREAIGSVRTARGVRA